MKYEHFSIIPFLLFSFVLHTKETIIAEVSPGSAVLPGVVLQYWNVKGTQKDWNDMYLVLRAWYQ